MFGRTNNLDRRMKEHKLAIPKGTEDKYVFLREHSDYEWGYEVLHECVRTDDSCFEEFYHIKLKREGYPMQNMRAGNDEHADYLRKASNVKSIEDLREFKRKLAQKSKRTTRKRIVYADEQSTTRFWYPGDDEEPVPEESPGLKAIRSRLHQRNIPAVPGDN